VTTSRKIYAEGAKQQCKDKDVYEAKILGLRKQTAVHCDALDKTTVKHDVQTCNGTAQWPRNEQLIKPRYTCITKHNNRWG
jgi:hypothetical protein